MCCLKIETETLLFNCFRDNSAATYSVQDLKNIVSKLSDFFGRYIFSNVSSDSLVEVVNEYPSIFALVGYDELKVKYKADSSSRQKNEKYFNFGYQQDITDKISEFAALIRPN